MACRLAWLSLFHWLHIDSALAPKTRRCPRKEDLVHLGHRSTGHSLHYTDVHEAILRNVGHNLCVWPTRIDPLSHRLHLLLGADAAEKQDDRSSRFYYNRWFDLYDGHSLLLAH